MVVGWRGSGQECSEIDECAEGTAGCDHTCINLPGTYECQCDEGFNLVSHVHVLLRHLVCMHHSVAILLHMLTAVYGLPAVSIAGVVSRSKSPQYYDCASILYCTGVKIQVADHHLQVDFHMLPRVSVSHTDLVL